MIEAEWLTATDPRAMLEFLDQRVDTRSLRLFVIECVARVRASIGNNGGDTLDALERWSDGSAERAADVATACAALRGDVEGDRSHPIGLGDAIAAELAEQAAQCRLIREIFGNPFRPTVFDPSWRTSTVLALIAGIGHDGAFDRLPILADALQDAGCDSDDILNHCRNPEQVHVRGCWVVDLVLGKE